MKYLKCSNIFAADCVYDFDDYILETIATCGSERVTAPSVDNLMDFQSTDEDEKEEIDAQPFLSFNIALKNLQIVKDQEKPCKVFQ